MDRLPWRQWGPAGPHCRVAVVQYLAGLSDQQWEQALRAAAPCSEWGWVGAHLWKGANLPAQFSPYEVLAAISVRGPNWLRARLRAAGLSIATVARWRAGAADWAHLPVQWWPAEVLRRALVQWMQGVPLKAALRQQRSGVEGLLSQNMPAATPSVAEGVSALKRRGFCLSVLRRLPAYRWPPQGRRPNGHFALCCGAVLGWRQFSLRTGGYVASPIHHVVWEEDTLWADYYEESEQALHAPGVHAWAFWRPWGAEEMGHTGAVALVAALRHVTLGDESWRAEGAQILRLWVPQGMSDDTVARLELRYRVPVHRVVCPARSAHAWAWTRLHRGELLVEET